MDPTNCAQVYGPAVGLFCRRAVEVGWDATATAGWLSGLAGVMASFLFAALVLVLGVRLEESAAGHIGVGESLPVLLAGFVSLVMTAMLGVIIAGLIVSVAKVQTALRGIPPSWRDTILAVAMVAGPWLLIRLLVRRPEAVWRRSWWGQGFQVVAFWASMLFATSLILMTVYFINRNDAALADAFPGWMVFTVLSGTGVLFALHDLNMPPVALDDRPGGSRLRIWRHTPQAGVTTGATPGA